jgi:hypothetical protein
MTINENDDALHVEQAMTLLSSDAGAVRAGKAISLLAAGLTQIPRCEWQSAFPNNVVATACLTRAFRQLRAAYVLMIWGYCAEVPAILRFAYECCGLARMLAHDPAQAEKWFDKERWVPDRRVRRWFSDLGSNTTGKSSDEILDAYSSTYSGMSDRSHPTAVACMSALSVDEHGFEPQLETVFNEEQFRTCAAGIAATAIFACFALRNAAVDEQVLNPQWRRDVAELAREILDSDMPHLDRDWTEEERQFEALQQRIQAAEKLGEALRRDPRSWLNLRDSEPPTGN